jgi:small GTP-binding protein
LGVTSIAVTDDGRRAASGSNDATIRLWDVESGKHWVLSGGHRDAVFAVAMTADGRRLVSGSRDKTLKVWDLESKKCRATLRGHTAAVFAVAIRPDGAACLSGSADGTIRVWDLESFESVAVLPGHGAPVSSLAVARDGRLAVSGGDDGAVRVWDLALAKCLKVLTGHAGQVNGVAITGNGQRALSGAKDATVRLWDLDGFKCIGSFEGHTAGVEGVALSADGHLGVSCSEDTALRVWDFPAITQLGAGGKDLVRYSNAKALLVGESGAGKTGLAIRLTQDRFESSFSTDAAWATQMKLPSENLAEGVEREIWLWDFAGQADYRLIHQLFMDETALAILVFNPQSEDPFDSLGQWDRDLQRAARRPFKKLLVAGRCDRGGLMVSRTNIEQFRAQRGFGDYIETSALTGAGCSTLRNAVVNNIAWDEIPWTASPRMFKLLKEEILQLKDSGIVLLRIGELKQQLDMRLPTEVVNVKELRAVIGLLAGPGIVWELGFGDFILMQPERLNAYAAAVIRSVRSHTDEIGCISEARVLSGDLDYQDMKRLVPQEEQIVLRAMTQTFVDHGLCLREHTDAGAILVFPSYFKRERPNLTGHPAAFVTYRFGGSLDEIYATLVVRLLHTRVFDKDQLWRFAADFKTQSGKRLGLKMTKKREGNAEITVYLDPTIPDDTKVTFIRYINDHLRAKDPAATRFRHYVCSDCGTPVESHRAIQERLRRGLKDIICSNCESRVLLDDLVEQKFSSSEFQQKARYLESQAKAKIDNESRELILLGHAFAVAGEAGHIFRPTPNSDWGIDGEIEFKDYRGRASGKRVYLQLKSGDSYLTKRSRDGAEVFTIRNPRHAEYWQQQAYPVMLVIRTSDGSIRWMNVTEYLRTRRGSEPAPQIVFQGDPFTATNLRRLRDQYFRPEPTRTV